MKHKPARSKASNEATRFLAEHPEVQYVDAIFVDLCGIIRGKRCPLADLPKLYASGMPMPYSLYYLDVTGECADPCGRGMTDGDPDGVTVPVPGTLVPVPWSDPPSAQVLMTCATRTTGPR